MAPLEALQCPGHSGEAMLCHWEQGFAIFGQHKACRDACEQLGAQEIFQPGNLMADRGLRGAHLDRGAGKAALAGGNLESALRVQRQIGAALLLSASWGYPLGDTSGEDTGWNSCSWPMAR